MSQNNDAIIERIQKLLSLANSDNENEAKLATSKANELLVKYNLNLQEVKDAQFDYVSNDVASTGLTIRPYQMMIASLLNEFFFVKVVISRKYTGRSSGQWASVNRPRAQYQKTIQLVGTKENCQIAAYIFTYLNTVFPHAWDTYRKTTQAPATLKVSYFTGLTAGIKEMLRETKWKVQDEMGLIVKEDPNLKKHVESFAKGSYGSNRGGEIDAETFRDGKQDGRNVKLRKPLTTDTPNHSGKTITNKKV